VPPATAATFTFARPQKAATCSKCKCNSIYVNLTLLLPLLMWLLLQLLLLRLWSRVFGHKQFASCAHINLQIFSLLLTLLILPTLPLPLPFRPSYPPMAFSPPARPGSSCSGVNCPFN